MVRTAWINESEFVIKLSKSVVDSTYYILRKYGELDFNASYLPREKLARRKLNVVGVLGS